MKKTSALLAAAVMLAACGESKDEFHQYFFYPQNPGGIELYADQTADTINFVSTDSWEARSTGEWLTITPTSYVIPSAYLQTSQPIVLTMSTNATGNIRKAGIEVDVDGNTLGMNVSQCPWLNIQYPAPTRKQGSDFATDAEAVQFALTLRDTSTALPLLFVTYQPGAILTSDAEWLALPDTVFAPGVHSYQPAVPQNTSSQERKATLTLTSGGISTQIHVSQDGKK